MVAVAALASLFGLEAASLALSAYELSTFFAIAFYTYIFLVLWQMLVFDLHLRHFGKEILSRFQYLTRGHHFLHFQNYLLLPGIIYWTTVALIFLNPFDELLKQALIIPSVVALAIAFWYLKTVFYAHREATRGTKQLIFVVKLYASYLAYAAFLGVGRYFSYGAGWVGLMVFAVTSLLLYQALFQHHYIGQKTIKFLLASGILIGIIGFAQYDLWNVNFYSAALVLTAIYNTLWGIIHHHWIDRNLTRQIVYEYLAVLFAILVIVFSITNFAQRI